MNFNASASLAAAAFAGLMAAQPALADVLNYSGSAHGYVTANITNKPAAPAASNVSAGAFMMTNATNSTSFAAYCVDIFHLLHNGNYTLVSGDSYLGTATSNALGALATNHLGSVVDATTSGAFQLAVWETVFERSANTNLAAGSFRAQSNSAVASLAGSWLDNNPLANAMSVSVWVSTDNIPSQNLVVFSPAVPEPETYAMMLAGLGLIGFTARRRMRAGRR